MGLYNRDTFIEKLNDAHLSKSECILCHEANVEFIDANPGLDGLEYICHTCNPRVVIQVSDVVLQSSIFSSLDKSSTARQRLQEEVRECREDTFKIYSDKLKPYFYLS